MSQLKYRAMLMLCTSHMDGLVYYTQNQQLLPINIPVSYIYERRQLQGHKIYSDVKVCRTPAFNSSPNKQEIEDMLAMRSEIDVITFISVDGILYPVTQIVLNVAHERQVSIAPTCRIKMLWGSFNVSIYAEAFHIYSGRSTVFIDKVTHIETI